MHNSVRACLCFLSHQQNSSTENHRARLFHADYCRTVCICDCNIAKCSNNLLQGDPQMKHNPAYICWDFDAIFFWGTPTFLINARVYMTFANHKSTRRKILSGHSQTLLVCLTSQSKCLTWSDKSAVLRSIRTGRTKYVCRSETFFSWYFNVDKLKVRVSHFVWSKLGRFCLGWSQTK